MFKMFKKRQNEVATMTKAQLIEKYTKLQKKAEVAGKWHEANQWAVKISLL